MDERMAAVADFAAGGTMLPVAGEWLEWYAISHAAFAALFLAAGGVVLAVALRLARKSRRLRDQCQSAVAWRLYDNWAIALTATGWAAFGLLQIGTVAMAAEVAKARLAPRAVIAEKAAELAGKRAGR